MSINPGIHPSPSDYFNLKDMPHIVRALDRNQKVNIDILHVIGNTPLVKLNKIPKEEGILCDMYVKCEFLNPGGSVKDRIGYRMVCDAEDRGVLIPGRSVLIEPTSGNTGIGIALAAAVKGYRCIIVLPEKMSDEKVNTLMALGAEIIRTPSDVHSDSPESNIGVASRMKHEIPHAVVLDQYNNPCNPLAHYDGTAEEVLWSLDDDVDMVVIGAGTCGTISGISHKIKERCPKCVVVGVDPYGSILAEPEELNKTDVTFYEVEGIGYDFFPKTLDQKTIDKWVKTDDRSAFEMALRLIKEEGLLCGGSSGSAMVGAIQAARVLKEGQKCVVLLPDSIRNYMTKFLSRQWLEAKQLVPVINNASLWWWNQVLDNTSATVQPVQSIPLRTTVAGALQKLKESNKAVLTVTKDDGQLIGIFTADFARKRIANSGGSINDDIEKFILKKFYKIDLAQSPTLGLVSRMLDITPYVIVVNKAKLTKLELPIGLISSEDLMSYIFKGIKEQNGS